jgi:sugar-specific transcriptional regulator TrmB
MRETIKILENIGLNKNQAKTYLTLLELGKSNVIRIAKESGITRTTIYDNIRALKEYDLVTESWEKGKKYFIAESPENIVKIVNEKKKVVEKVIPSLLKTFKVSKTNPRITIMNGVKALKKMHSLSLAYNKNKRTRWLGEVESLFTYLSENFIKNYVAKRVQKGIRNQVITTDVILKRKEMYSARRNKESLREIKYLPGVSEIDTAMFNFDDIVFLVSSAKEGFVVMIESKEFAKTFNSMFDFMWGCGKEV